MSLKTLFQGASPWQPQAPGQKPVAVSIGLCDAKCVSMLIDWDKYAVVINGLNNYLVNIDLDAIFGGAPPLAKIACIGIDTGGNPSPVFAYFPDTGYVVTVADSRGNFYPVLTGGRKFQVAGPNMWQNGAGFQTRLFVMDALPFPMTDTVNQGQVYHTYVPGLDCSILNNNTPCFITNNSLFTSRILVKSFAVRYSNCWNQSVVKSYGVGLLDMTAGGTFLIGADKTFGPVYEDIVGDFEIVRDDLNLVLDTRHTYAIYGAGQLTKGMAYVDISYEYLV